MSELTRLGHRDDLVNARTYIVAAVSQAGIPCRINPGHARLHPASKKLCKNDPCKT